MPPAPPFVELSVSSFQVTTPRIFPHTVMEDIETLNGVNISRPFRAISALPDQWMEDYTSVYSDRQSADDVGIGSYSLNIAVGGEAEEVSKITHELFSSLSQVFDFSRKGFGEFTISEEDLSVTRGVLSGFFIRHLAELLNTESRIVGLQQLQSTLSVFAHATDSFNAENMTDEESPHLRKLHRRCVSFRMALTWALDDLRMKIERNYTELPIMKCIKAVFILVLSLYYRESGYSMDSLEISERSDRNGLEAEPIVIGIDSDAIPYNGLRSFYQPREYVNGISSSSAMHPKLSHYQDIFDDSNLSTNQYDGFMAQEEQVFLERRLPVPTDGALVTMFHSHIVPMTPVVARNNGEYVRGTQRTELSIMDAAYAYDTSSGGCIIPCKFVLNRTYTPENNGSTQGPRYLTYIGFVFPDNTMLSYIPIKYVRIVYEDSPHRQPILRSGSTTFAFLHMDLPNTVYQSLKALAKDIYLRKNPSMLFVDHFEEQLLDGRMVRIEVLVKSERTVRIEDHGKYLDYPVLQALFQCRHDLCGKSLMHLRFTSTKRGSQRMQLRLILFGITVERNLVNYDDPIFELLNSPPGPIQTPLSIPGVLL